MAPLQTVRVEPGATVCDTQETPHDQGRDIHIPELPPFQIRKFVSSVRSLDFSKCWPFRQKILEKSLTFGVKPLLPPLNSPPKRHVPVEREQEDHDGNQRVLVPHEETESVQHCAQNEADYEHLETSSPEEGDHEYNEDDDDDRFKTGLEEEEEEEEQENRGYEEIAQVFDAHTVGMQSDTTTNIEGPDNISPGNILGFEKSCHISSDSACDCDDTIANVEVDLIDLGKTQMKDRRSDAASILCQSPASCGESMELDVNINGNGVHAKFLNNEAMLDANMGSTKESDTGSKCKDSALQEASQVISESLCEKESDHTASEHKDSVLQEASQVIAESLCEKADDLKHMDSLSGERGFTGPQHKADKGRNAEDFSFPGLNIDVLTPQVCPVCLNFTSSSNTALNAHIDHCLESVLPSENGEGRACKSRTKPRKMRSMVEICAVALPRTLEDLELCSEKWALDDTHTNDQSSNDMQSDDHPSDVSAFVRKGRVSRRKLGKFISSHLESPWKENTTLEIDQPSIDQRQDEPKNLSARKTSERVTQRSMSSMNANAESEELQYTGDRFLEGKSTISAPLKSSPKHIDKFKTRKKNDRPEHLDNCALDDEEDDLVLLSRLETTILDTSADDEKRLQKDFSSPSEKSGSDFSVQEVVHKSGDICVKYSGECPSWIVTNGKYQMKVPSLDSKRLDEALKNRKRPQIDFDWIDEDVHIDAFPDNENVDQRAGKSWKNKRTMHKTKKLVNVASQEMGKNNFPKAHGGMKTQINVLEGATLCQDTYLLQDGRLRNNQYNSLKCKSPETLKEKTKSDNIGLQTQSVENWDSFNASKYCKTSKTPESMSLILDTVECGITLESHSACSLDENAFAKSHDNDTTAEEHAFTQNRTSKEVVEKIHTELEHTMHTHRAEQGLVIGKSLNGIEQLRACQNLDSDCASVRDLSKNRSSIELSEETCSSSLVESVNRIPNAASWKSQENGGHKMVVQTCNPTGESDFCNKNGLKKQHIISSSVRGGDSSCPQIGDCRMTYGYVPDPVKQSFPINQINHHQLDIEPHRLNMNESSHSLGTQEISIPGVILPLEQHFLRNNSHERYHATFDVHDRQDVRSDSFKRTGGNRNQQVFYQKDSENKHPGRNRIAQQQNHVVLNEGTDKGLQMSLQTDMAHQSRLDSMNSRVLTSNLDSISTSQLGLQTGRMSDLLDNFVRSKAIMAQDPMHIMSGCQPTSMPCPQHVLQDLHGSHEYDNAFPSQSTNNNLQTSTGKGMHHPQYLHPNSYSAKERSPGCITNYVNPVAGTIGACGEQNTSSVPHMPRNITSSRINGDISEAGLNNYSAVEYSGDQGVVHIFGNPVFKLMGKNVMVTNSNIKSLAIGNSMGQNGEQWFYHSSVPQNTQYPQDRFRPTAQVWHGDPNGLKNHSFAVGNLRTPSHTLQDVSSNQFGHMEPSTFKDHHGQPISCIQEERSRILHSLPQTHLKQQLPVGRNSAKKQDAVETFMVQDCLPNAGTSVTSMLCSGANSISGSNSILIHDGHVQAPARAQAFPSSTRCFTKPKTREGTSTIANRCHQQSGTLADIVKSSERKNSRQVLERVWDNTSHTS